MIDVDTINELQPVHRADVKKALAIIHASGIVQTQIQKEKQRVIDGNADEPIESAAATLLDVRKKTQALANFGEICYTCAKELNRNA